MDDTWLIVHLPTQIYVWNLGEDPDQDAIDDAVVAARVFTDFPADDDWAASPDLVHTNLSITFGEPHEKLLARATVGPDLSKVSAKAIDEYRARYAANLRQARIDETAALLAAMDPALLADVLAHPSLTRSAQ